MRRHSSAAVRRAAWRHCLRQLRGRGGLRPRSRRGAVRDVVPGLEPSARPRHWALAGVIFFIVLGALLLGGEEGGDRASGNSL